MKTTVVGIFIGILTSYDPKEYLFLLVVAYITIVFWFDVLLYIKLVIKNKVYSICQW